MTFALGRDRNWQDPSELGDVKVRGAAWHCNDRDGRGRSGHLIGTAQ